MLCILQHEGSMTLHGTTWRSRAKHDLDPHDTARRGGCGREAAASIEVVRMLSIEFTIRRGPGGVS